MHTITSLKLQELQKLPADRDVQDRIDYLSGILKETGNAGADHHPDGSSTRARLVDYVVAELADLFAAREKERRLHAAARSQAFKVRFDLSVAQLACLLRMFADAGIITNRNMSALLRCVALGCETKRAGRISAQSLRIKFYEIEDATRQTVHQVVGKLLAQSGTHS